MELSQRFLIVQELRKSIYLLFLFTMVVLTGCSDKYEHVADENFIGEWQLQGRSMFEGMIIEIARNEDGKLQGKIKKLNDNKYVQFFAEAGDIWISKIDRNSNYQFNITEKKIGRELFSLYGLGSSSGFRAQFIDDNTIGISSGRADPLLSNIRYVRVK